MHSKIFQVSKQPIAKKDYYNADKYLDWFVGEIADYTDDIHDEQDIISCLEWLGEVNGLSVGVGNRTLCVESRALYFKDRYTSFQHALRKVQNADFEAFCDDVMLKYNVSALAGVYNDRFGFYIDFDDDLMSLDEWVRYVKEGRMFYIGAVIDYHF